MNKMSNKMLMIVAFMAGLVILSIVACDLGFSKV
jgi:hypothetical protein